MRTEETTETLLYNATEEYTRGNFALAERILFRAAKNPVGSDVEKERVFDCLAGIACQQGLYASASYWYLKVLHSRGNRLRLGDAELKDTIRNYRVLLGLSQMHSGDENNKRAVAESSVA